MTPTGDPRGPDDNQGAIGSARLLVFPPDEGSRLDLFLAARTGLSRRAARRLIGDGLVVRNGEPLRVQSRELRAGDVIDLLRTPAELGIDPEQRIALPVVLHEDRWLMVVNKAAGVLCQPADGSSEGELALDQRLLLGLANRDGRRPFLRLVHRLDRLTSGAVLFARNPQALQPLSRAWSEGQVDRRYFAVVEGDPSFETIRIDRPIGRDRGHCWRFRVADRGRQATTDVRVLDRPSEGLAVVECRLLTGRTHQVRVHLAAIGHPVVGDRLYGSNRCDVARRPLLHAAELELPHPKSGERLRVTAPLPEDMKAIVAQQP